jgi:hypothetical protein
VSKRTIFLLGIGVIATLVMGVQVVAFASHPEASLAGSNFEIDDDANLKVDDPAPPSLDWANVSESRQTDKVNGTGDNSYAGGVKEDTACPSETTDSIPPNKSDLLSFHAYTEAATAGNKGFLNLAWSRVSEPSGTTLMDFELNQSNSKCTGSPNNVRTPGDLLIEYAIDQGGARADITVRTWDGSKWGAPADLDVNSPICGNGPCAAGTINSSQIPAADSDGLIATGSKQARTFGEAQLDLRYIFQANECVSFGSAMLKSRSSDSFTSQLKDFVSPVNVNLQNCGKVIIRKDTLPDETDQNFNYTKVFAQDDDLPTTPPTPDTPTTLNFQLNDNDADGNPKVPENRTFNGVLFGSGLTVEEVNLPAGWQLKTLDCSASSTSVPAADRVVSGAKVTFKIDSADDILDCTYTNERPEGALKILKQSTKTGNPLVSNAGAVFSYDDTDATTPANVRTVTDDNTAAAPDEDATVGEVCVDGLKPGEYNVNEDTPPSGYGDASQLDQKVTVAPGTDCDVPAAPATDPIPGPGTGATATFTNPPLADIQVNFKDGGSGETALDAAGITCTNQTGDTKTDDPVATGWDNTTDVTGIEAAATITCTIPIDP